MRFRLLPNSLKKKLLFYLLLVTVTTWSFTAFVSYKESQQDVAKLFKAELSQSAGVLHAFVESMLHEGSLSEHWDVDHTSNLLHTHELTYQFAGKIAFQLWSMEDGLILRSESAPKFPLSQYRNGYSLTTIDDHRWYVFSIANHNGEYIIHVGQREDVQEAIIIDITRQLVQNFLLGLPVLGVAIWIIVSHSMSPMSHLTDQLSKREAGYLESLPLKGLPEEILPLVKELNTLFEQLEQAFENERHFTSDASHELRTPLAGLMTQIQVAQKAQDPAVRIQALEKAQLAVLRMTRMVQQLLTLSRVLNQNENLTRINIDINHEIVGVISEIEPAAHRKNIDIEFQHGEELAITGNMQLINVLVRNLIENAVKYSPQGGKVRIRTVREKNQVLLCVEDNGPGIGEDDYDRLTQRFYRCVETAGNAEGSGLGLSIVQRIAAIHEAELTFSRSDLGGLKVQVDFELAVARPVTLSQRKPGFFGRK